MTRNTKTWRGRAMWMIILLGGFALRLYRLGADSLWYDETVSAHLASKSIPALVAHTARDIHPPGYYLLLHFWTRLAGDSEFALAFFSLVFGVLLIPLCYALARRLMGRRVAPWTALLVATSPYNLWYSQEVRMYTLGAALGMVALWCALKPPFTPSASPSGRGSFEKRDGAPRHTCMAGYILAAAMGLYVLYYFAFLLIVLNLLIIGDLLWARRFRELRGWLLAQFAVLVLYLPWLPIAWRQATDPPVPPWRGFTPLPTVLLESWSALSLGQSVQPSQVWPLLLATGVLFLLGLRSQISKSQPPNPKSQFTRLRPQALLAAYTFGPLVLIHLASLLTPLYHVRYLFTYAPPFYILLGAGLARLTRRSRLPGALAALVVLAGSAFSTHELHTNPRYAADDFRSAVGFIAERWRPGDVVLINAGYTYTGFLYYYDGRIAGRARLADYQPSQAPASASSGGPLLLTTGTINGGAELGWKDPNSDFYATTQAETAAALTRLTETFPRIWMLRIYDTVTDQEGFIRAWLAAHTTPFEDQLFSGEASMRVQGFMSTSQPPPARGAEVPLEGGMTLLSWDLNPTAPAGGPLDVVLWWQVDATFSSPAQRPGAPHAVSLKLWDASDQGHGAEPDLAAQQDEWPVGSLLFTPDWPPGRAIRHPMRLWLPADLPTGQYWLNVEMYDPRNVQPLPRRDGQGPSISLGSVTVTPDQ